MRWWHEPGSTSFNKPELKRAEQELDEEIGTHLELEAAEH